MYVCIHCLVIEPQDHRTAGSIKPFKSQILDSITVAYSGVAILGKSSCESSPGLHGLNLGFFFNLGFRRSHSDNPGEAYRSASDEVRLN